MDQETFNRGLIDFINESPTAFHAVSAMESMLKAAGFSGLNESDAWSLDEGKGYYVIRNGSSIITFTTGKKDKHPTGFRMTGAHTDSPCLKIKPDPLLKNNGYVQLGVEVYGGALLNPWFDRDLSIAGRVSFLDEKNTIRSCLVDFKRPVAFISSLAIHFDREANKNRSINAQKDLPPIIMNMPAGEFSFSEILSSELKNQGLCAEGISVNDFELYLYDTQSSSLLGMNNEYIAGGRLDNLLSCYTGIQALIYSDRSNPCMMVCNDHEEVGSVSFTGAQGTFLRSVLQRLSRDPENYYRMLSRSMFISMDNAHGIHPNYADKYDINHGPVLNKGPVIKMNAGQRYASDSETVAVIRSIASGLAIPLQTFVMRSDLACGSTIGPLTSAEVGLKTVDMGVPTFAMHSIREVAGSTDPFLLFSLICGFNSSSITI
ncbi:MAG: M18 family aminopeptidase [Spirochaetae bacterium HGW-Spirochaetae-1]|jgi:aspartyl aminopeptidase|nr:MAG: M18 family aminopeptidase [Spirochaetae bacterium HGW-Spirochaetae-1]